MRIFKISALWKSKILLFHQSSGVMDACVVSAKAVTKYDCYSSTAKSRIGSEETYTEKNVFFINVTSSKTRIKTKLFFLSVHKICWKKTIALVLFHYTLATFNKNAFTFYKLFFCLIIFIKLLLESMKWYVSIN